MSILGSKRTLGSCLTPFSKTHFFLCHCPVLALCSEYVLEDPHSYLWWARWGERGGYAYFSVWSTWGENAIVRCFFSRIATAAHRASRDRIPPAIRCAPWSSLFLVIKGWVKYYIPGVQVLGCWNKLHSRPILEQARRVLFA